jgi:hypothetical protein
MSDSDYSYESDIDDSENNILYRARYERAPKTRSKGKRGKFSIFHLNPPSEKKYI